MMNDIHKSNPNNSFISTSLPNFSVPLQPLHLESTTTFYAILPSSSPLPPPPPPPSSRRRRSGSVTESTGRREARAQGRKRSGCFHAAGRRPQRHHAAGRRNTAGSETGQGQNRRTLRLAPLTRLYSGSMATQVPADERYSARFR